MWTIRTFYTKLPDKSYKKPYTVNKTSDEVNVSNDNSDNKANTLKVNKVIKD